MTETHPVHKRLIRCTECGMWTGIINRSDLKDPSVRPSQDQFVKVLCRCDGPLCRRCGKNQIMRPGSCCYDEADDSVWHIPGFAGMAPCAECKKKESRS